LPHLVAKALRPDGGINLLGVVGGLIRRPTHVAALTRLAGDFAEGLRALRRCRDLLGLGLGFGIPAHGDLVSGLYARAANPHRGVPALADSHCVVSTRALSIGRGS
jgi:hypothetical protein